jgi:hypothetical protein
MKIVVTGLNDPRPEYFVNAMKSGEDQGGYAIYMARAGTPPIISIVMRVFACRRDVAELLHIADFYWN